MIRTFCAFALTLLAYCHPATATDCSSFTPWGEPQLFPARPITMLCRTAYVSAHDDERLVPAWVAWTLTPEHAMGCLPRKNQFAVDPDLPAGHRARPVDYTKSGFDQGHLSPNADHAWDADVMRQSFLMSNMSPQRPQLNRLEWEALEAATRAWTLTMGTLVIIDGPIYDTDPMTIGPDHVAVPTRFWKVVISPEKDQAIAFEMENGTVRKGPLDPYVVSIAQLQHDAGITIPLPPGIDTDHAAAPWDGEPAAFTRAKKAACSTR
jgi:endonuclease G